VKIKLAIIFTTKISIRLKLLPRDVIETFVYAFKEKQNPFREKEELFLCL